MRLFALSAAVYVAYVTAQDAPQAALKAGESCGTSKSCERLCHRSRYETRSVDGKPLFVCSTDTAFTNQTEFLFGKCDGWTSSGEILGICDEAFGGLICGGANLGCVFSAPKDIRDALVVELGELCKYYEVGNPKSQPFEYADGDKGAICSQAPKLD
jgi:hypothetical protein